MNMDDWVEINRDERHIKRERAKAREMRQTPYYQDLFRKGICHYCGQKFPQDQLTLDHIVPVSRGGRSTRGNLVVACLDCNQKKKYLTPVEMLLRQLEEEQPDA
jgi:5-methylcytosine-specific restriction endonuclease McrA